MANQLFHQTGSNEVSDILCAGIRVNVNEKQEASEYTLQTWLVLSLGCSATRDIAMVIKEGILAGNIKGKAAVTN